MNRLLRLLVLALMLLTALPGAVTSAHADCGTQGDHPVMSSADGGHDHSAITNTADQQHDDGGSTKDGPTNDGPAKFCHSAAAGCPGCVTPAEATLPQPGFRPLTFRHIAVSGESAEANGDLRPPKVS